MIDKLKKTILTILAGAMILSVSCAPKSTDTAVADTTHETTQAEADVNTSSEQNGEDTESAVTNDIVNDVTPSVEETHNTPDEDTTCNDTTTVIDEATDTVTEDIPKQEETDTEAPAEDTDITTQLPDETQSAEQEEKPIGTTKFEETIKPEETTKPSITAATETTVPHTHAYGVWTVTKAAACTSTGTEERTCACGDKQTRTIQAKGHTEITVKGKAATCADTGLTDGKQCTVCGVFTVKQNTITASAHTYVTTKAPNTDPYSVSFLECGEKKCTACHDTKEVEYTLPDVDSKEYARLLAQRMLYYINEYRAAEGAPKAQMLPNMTAYAEYRAVQLSTNFAHDAIDERRAATELKYGQYTVHNSELYTEEEIEALKTLGYYTITSDSVSFYSAPVGEAIGKSGFWSDLASAIKYFDEVAKARATGFYTSKGHWNYIGRPTNIYISIGTYITDNLYTCICTSDTDIYG